MAGRAGSRSDGRMRRPPESLDDFFMADAADVGVLGRLGRLGRLGVTAFCLMDDPEVAAEAARRGTTRAEVAMERSLPKLAGGIVAIGNAPTALLRLVELLAAGAPPPALVVGVPVGFVNAAESKDALARQDCPYITALGPKGGSALAASIINALAIMALEEVPS